MWCESTFNNKFNSINLLLHMLIFLFINFVKVYKAWLWAKWIDGLNKNEGSTWLNHRWLLRGIVHLFAWHACVCGTGFSWIKSMCDLFWGKKRVCGAGAPMSHLSETIGCLNSGSHPIGTAKRGKAFSTFISSVFCHTFALGFLFYFFTFACILNFSDYIYYKYNFIYRSWKNFIVHKKC